MSQTNAETTDVLMGCSRTLGSNGDSHAAADEPRDPPPRSPVCTSCCPSCTTASRATKSKRRRDGASQLPPASSVQDSSTAATEASFSTAVSNTTRDTKVSSVCMDNDIVSGPSLQKGFQSGPSKHGDTTGDAAAPDRQGSSNQAALTGALTEDSHLGTLIDASKAGRAFEAPESTVLRAPVHAGSCTAPASPAVSACCRDPYDAPQAARAAELTAARTASSTELGEEKVPRPNRGCNCWMLGGVNDARMEPAGQVKQSKQTRSYPKACLVATLQTMPSSTKTGCVCTDARLPARLMKRSRAGYRSFAHSLQA